MLGVIQYKKWASAVYRTVTLDEVSKRTAMLLAIKSGKILNLADITYPGLITQVLEFSTLELVARNYPVTQSLAKDIHQMESRPGVPQFDGILYPSLKNTGAKCIVLFDRAAKSIEKAVTIPLNKHVHWSNFIEQYGIAIVED